MKAILLLSSLIAVNAFSQSTQWDLDKSHSSINFGIDHMVISETVGKFTDYSTEVKADKPDFTDAQFKVILQVESINTDDAKRDGHLKGADFFNVEKNPTITFVGEKFEKQKNGQYIVKGKLTMNGVTKNVSLNGKFNGIAKDPWGGTRAGLKVWGTVDRYDYGLKYNSVLEAGGMTIGKEVRINANLELIKKV
jgi:polyisoprenoid-binding protein YceI